MPIRTKLTIWYTSVLAMILLAFGVGVYVVLTLSMTRQLETRLQQAANSALAVFRATAVQVESQRTGRTIIQPLAEIDPFLQSEIYVELITRQGQVFAVSGNIAQNSQQEMLDEQSFINLRQLDEDRQNEVFRTVRIRGGPSLYVLTRAVRNPTEPQVIGYMQVAATSDSIETAQRVLVLAMLSLGAIGLVGSAAFGAFLARRALRPVDRITQTAMAIYRAENLDQRVQEPIVNDDEVARLSQAFNEMLDRLARLFNAQQRLMADVSHEMRTPLTVIRGNVDLLSAMGCADQESLDALKRESDRMTRMVGDLLLLSKADTGQLSVQLAPIPLAPLINDVERSGRVLAGERLRVMAEVNPSLTIMADNDRLKQVLLNLVDNAIKHTPDGGLVKVEALKVFNGFVRISVNDSGVGIPEADLPHVFERFYRVEKSRSRERGGSGLGLSIAQKIVEAHQGRITATSKIGVGSTFDVYIPLVTVELEEADRDAFAARAS
jgi:two-component system, OmpR family, sensor kinase